MVPSIVALPAQIPGALALAGRALPRIARVAQTQIGRLADAAGIYGGVYGVGSTEPEGTTSGDGTQVPASTGSALAQRAGGGVIGLMTGEVAGGALAKAGQLAGRGYDAVRRAVFDNASPRRAAEAALNRELQASGTSPQELLDAVLPGHKNLSREQQVRVFEIFGEEMQRAPRGAITRTTNRVSQEMGTTVSTARDQLKSMRGRFDTERGGSPLTLAELPSVANAPRVSQMRGNVSDEEMLAFSETPARQLLDTIANSGGRAASRVNTVLAARQMGTRGRLQTALADAVGGDDFQTMAQQLDDQLSQQGTAAYRAAFAAERPVAPLLDQAMARVTNRIGQRSGVVRDALLRAREEFYRELSIPGQPPARQVVDSLQQAMDARGVLNDMIGEATRAGNNQIARALTQMHREVTAALRHTNPEWWRANQIWGDARSGQQAMRLGEEFATRAGPALRRSLTAFDRMPPAMQERFRVAHMQRLHDALANATDSVDLARLFRNQAVRDAVRHVHGDDVANRLIRRIRDETIATSTNRMGGNSRTALRLESRDRLNEGTDVAGAAQMLSQGGIRSALLDRASRFLADRRNVPLADMALTPVSRPEQIIPLLNRLSRAPASRPQPVAPHWASRGARTGSAVNALGIDWSRR